MNFGDSTLALLEEVDKCLRYRRKGPAAMEEQEKISLQLETADGDFFQKSIPNLPLDGGSRKDRNAQAGNKRLLDSLGAP